MSTFERCDLCNNEIGGGDSPSKTVKLDKRTYSVDLKVNEHFEYSMDFPERDTCRSCNLKLAKRYVEELKKRE